MKFPALWSKKLPHIQGLRGQKRHDGKRLRVNSGDSSPGWGAKGVDIAGFKCKKAERIDADTLHELILQLSNNER